MRQHLIAIGVIATSALVLVRCGGGIDAPQEGLPDDVAQALFDAPTGTLTDDNATAAVKQALLLSRFDLSGAAEVPDFTGAADAPESWFDNCGSSEEDGSRVVTELDYDCLHELLSDLDPMGSFYKCTYGGQVYMDVLYSGAVNSSPIAMFYARYTDVEVGCDKDSVVPLPFHIRDCSMEVRSNGDPSTAGTVMCNKGECTIDGLKVVFPDPGHGFCWKIRPEGKPYLSVTDVGDGNAIYEYGNIDSSCTKFESKWRDSEGDVTVTCEIVPKLPNCDPAEFAALIERGELVDLVGTCVISRDPAQIPDLPPAPSPSPQRKGCRVELQTESEGTLLFEDAEERAFITDEGDYLLVFSEEERAGRNTFFSLRIPEFTATQRIYEFIGDPDNGVLLKVGDTYFDNWTTDNAQCTVSFFSLIEETETADGWVDGEIDCTMAKDGAEETVTGTISCIIS